MTFRFVSLSSHDTALLETATLGTMNWCGERFTISDIRSRAEFKHYTRFLQERGDFGILAFEDSELAGVCWALFLPENDKGYGFVDEQTPEMSLWVAEEFRGQGLGRLLIQELIRTAQNRKLAQISLSVEPENFAKQLYLSEGFVAVPGGEEDGVMLLTLKS